MAQSRAASRNRRGSAAPRRRRGRAVAAARAPPPRRRSAPAKPSRAERGEKSPATRTRDRRRRTRSCAVLAAHQGEEIYPRGGGFGVRLGALGGEPRGDRRERLGFDRSALVWTLPERVEDRGEARTLCIASENMAITALSARQFDDRARNRRLADIERRAVAARASAQHDEAGLHRLEIARAMSGPTPRDGLAESSAREEA